MSLDREAVSKIAYLARIEVPESRLDGLAGELDNIINWVEQLAEVNTDNVEPMTRVGDRKMPMRDDVVTDGEKQADVTANAPVSQDGFYLVPKVVE
ncbi:Asp-tRNA(Asn)/Glu-tRNA(Gln) amidotransferase subunit GatC [Alphaproteobacteria bacterium HT1-32]|nr:Asp-tRNA(Asn)/Glu-tRNA(Gln) amidotransferase subunit GatC [Alphaproteobacteria bacterium HT1-32]|tara:strand:+ start:2525 stop:2812 length:288 start_codon:yes stop_codon:yes gene_type:complete